MKKTLLVFLIFISALAQGQNVTKKVLFIGNSYSYYVPSILQSIASSVGDNLTYGSSIVIVGGYSFYLHSQDANTLALIQQGGWDVVVLQEKSTNPSEPLAWVEESVYPYAEFLVNQVNAYNSGAEKMFYMTWGRKDGDAARCPTNSNVCTYIGMDDLTRERYMYMATAYHAIISPVGPVWRYIRSHYPDIDLYQPDGSHPSDAGFYASACTFYAALFRKDPTLITYDYNLSATVAAEIRNAAKLVVTDSLLTWHIGEYDTDTQVPTVPSGLSYSNLSETGFTLSWTASTDNVGVTGYDVYRNGSLVNSVTTTSAGITGLTASTTYAMTVRAKDAAGNISDASTALNVTTTAPVDTQAPGTPTGLAASNITGNSFTLSWTASTDNVGVTGYDIYRNGTLVNSVTGVSCSLSGLTAGTVYTFTVRARDAAGNVSSLSTGLNVTMGDTHSPSVPSGLSASSITETGFTLSWTASSDNVAVSGYDIYLNSVLINSVTGTSANISGLSASTTYSVAMRARDAAGNISSLSSSLNVTTIDTHAPSAPSGLTTSSITETSFSLTWTPSTDNVGVTGYDIYMNGKLISSVSSPTASITGLTLLTTYNMTVKAKDASGNISSESSVLKVTTPDTHAPSVPLFMTASNITETSFTLSWTASTDNVGVTSYDIYSNGRFIVTVTGTSVNLSGLAASTTYTLTIRAKDEAGNISSPSTSLDIRTSDTHVPSAPADLKANSLTETNFTLTWSASSDNVGVTGYKVLMNGTQMTSVTGTSAIISGLTVNTTYNMTVEAMDAAGNVSAPSDILAVKTPDSHAPTSPTGLKANNATKSGFTLSWNPSTDNVRVTDYEVFENGILFVTTSEISVNLTNLVDSVDYSITIIAMDEAGNRSKPSDPLSIITKAYNLLTHNSLSSIVIYPNPIVGSEFYVNFNREYIGKVDVEILNLSGVIMLKQTIECSGHLITIPNIFNKIGIYILRIGYQNMLVSHKIIVAQR